WQADLERIDADLAAGRITVEEHRKRSDDLLAAASSAPWTPAAATSADQRWVARNPSMAAESTPTAVEPTAVVQPNAVEQTAVEQTAVEPAAESAKTQVPQANPPDQAGAQVSTVQPQSTPPQQSQPIPAQSIPAQPTRSWHSQSVSFPVVPNTDAPPPWRTSTNVRPPWEVLPDGGTAGDAFRHARPSGKPAIVFAAVALLVALLAGAAVWWFGLRHTTTADGTPIPVNAVSQTPSGSAGSSTVRSTATSVPSSSRPRPPTTSRPPKPGDALVSGLDAKFDHAMPGTLYPGKHGVPVADGVPAGAYDKGEAGVLSKAGVTRLYLIGSHSGGQDYAVLVIPNRSAGDARASTKAVTDFQRRLGLASGNRSGLPATVTVLGGGSSAGTFERAIYPSGEDTVVVGASTRGDPSGLAQRFKQLAQSVVAALPPK
ncbi:MAG: hypothetical protein J2O49_08405, partial [Sciscionella sp.]|nr:hypothetical protein [Sciscionella sp.]